MAGLRTGEEPRYVVVERLGSLQIRSYGPSIAAETVVAGEEGASRAEGRRRLASYAGGGNAAHIAFPLTVPVAQEAGSKPGETGRSLQEYPSGGQWRIRVAVPAQFTLGTLPRPDDPAIHIVAIPPQTVGVFRASGSPGPAATEGSRREVLRLLEGSGWAPTGDAVLWLYDPPGTLPFLRRNEAAVPVDRPVPHTPPVAAQMVPSRDTVMSTPR